MIFGDKCEFLANNEHEWLPVVSSKTITSCDPVKIVFCRSEGFPRTGYLVPGRDTPRAQPNTQSCWDAAAAVAVAVTWKITKYEQK